MSFLVKYILIGTLVMKQLRMSWKSPQGNASLETFLGKIKRELFKIPKKLLVHSNFSKEEWECIRPLTND